MAIAVLLFKRRTYRSGKAPGECTQSQSFAVWLGNTCLFGGNSMLQTTRPPSGLWNGSASGLPRHREASSPFLVTVSGCHTTKQNEKNVRQPGGVASRGTGVGASPTIARSNRGLNLRVRAQHARRGVRFNTSSRGAMSTPRRTDFQRSPRIHADQPTPKTNRAFHVKQRSTAGRTKHRRLTWRTKWTG